MSDEGFDIPVSTPGALDAIALLNRIAEAVEKTGKKAEEAGAKTASLGNHFSTMGQKAVAFNALRDTLSTIAGAVSSLASGVVDLAAEQSHLDDMSRRLGLSFDDAAGAAGRFTDEVDVMNTAGQFAARGIRLTQDELNAMTRAAARNAQQTGVETSAALGTLEEALVRGRARGLLPFGQGLADAAAHGYTLREGLAALVAQERNARSATDDARTAAQGLSDAFGDGARALATMASDALGLPGLVANITREVTDLVTQLNEVNRLGAQSHRDLAQHDERAPAAAEFAATQRQVSELAARAGISDRTRLALPNVNRLTPEQLRELSGRLSVLVHHQNDAAPATADSIANAFRSGSGGAFSTSADHTENDLDRLARGAATRAPSAAEQRRAIERAVADARRFAEGAIAANDTAAAGPSDRAARNRRVSADGGAAAAAQKELAAEDALRAEAAAATLEDVAERHRLAMRAIGEVSNRDHRRQLTEREAITRRAAEDAIVFEADAATRHFVEEQQHAERSIRLATDTALQVKAAELEARPSKDRRRANRTTLTDGEAANDNASEYAAQDAGRDAANAGPSTLASLADQLAAKEATRLNTSIERHESYTGRLRELYAQQSTAAQIAAEQSAAAFGNIGDAFGGAVLAVAEEGKTAKAASQQMLEAILSGVAKESSIKGSFYLAQSLGNLATGNLPGAGAAAAASVGFFGVAAAAGYAAHEAKPAAPASSAAGGGGSQRAADVAPQRRDSAGDSTVIYITYAAPVIGGRESTDAELGERLNRYQRAAGGGRR